MTEPATVLVDGTELPWRDGLTVAAALAERGEPHDAVATALNGRFLPRKERGRTLLAPGDHLMLFHAIVGG